MVGIISLKRFSVHCVSSWETVACQRYNKLNSTDTTLPWPRGETSWSGSRVFYEMYVSKGVMKAMHAPGSPSRGQDATKTRHVLSQELRLRSRAI